MLLKVVFKVPANFPGVGDLYWGIRMIEFSVLSNLMSVKVDHVF